MYILQAIGERKKLLSKYVCEISLPNDIEDYLQFYTSSKERIYSPVYDLRVKLELFYSKLREML
jgi:hypothetical protein